MFGNILIISLKICILYGYSIFISLFPLDHCLGNSIAYFFFLNMLEVIHCLQSTVVEWRLRLMEHIPRMLDNRHDMIALKRTLLYEK